MAKPRMSRIGLMLICDVCEELQEAGDCRPFSLVANFLKEDGKRTTRSFGSLDICKRCWSSKATDNRRPGHDSDPFA